MKPDDLQGFIVDEDKNYKELIEDYLGKNNVLDMQNRDQQMVAVSKAVSEIPWGMGRTIEEVLVTKGIGTCTGKHRVLEQCFKFLEIPYIPVVCTFHWGEQDLLLPQHLRAIINEGPEWSHGHNFVQSTKLSGEKIDIDISWDPAIAHLGFITTNDWDGEKDLIAVKNVIGRWDNVSMGEMKVKLIEEFITPEQRERRKRFLDAALKWTAEERKKQGS